MKKNSRPLWLLPINMVTKAGKRIYKGIHGVLFTTTKDGKVPKSGLKYRPVNGSPNGSKKFVITPRGTITSSKNFMNMAKPKY